MIDSITQKGRGSDPHNDTYRASFNVGAAKNKVADVGAAESDSPDMPFMTQPTPSTVVPIQTGQTGTFYDKDAVAHPNLPMKQGPMQAL